MTVGSITCGDIVVANGGVIGANDASVDGGWIVVGFFTGNGNGDVKGCTEAISKGDLTGCKTGSNVGNRELLVVGDCNGAFVVCIAGGKIGVLLGPSVLVGALLVGLDSGDNVGVDVLGLLGAGR